MVTADLVALITENTRTLCYIRRGTSRNRCYSLGESCGVKVIEDAAHAFGAKRNGKNIGTTGDYVVFHFSNQAYHYR